MWKRWRRRRRRLSGQISWQSSFSRPVYRKDQGEDGQEHEGSWLCYAVACWRRRISERRSLFFWKRCFWLCHSWWDWRASKKIKQTNYFNSLFFSKKKGGGLFSLRERRKEGKKKKKSCCWTNTKEIFRVPKYFLKKKNELRKTKLQKEKREKERGKEKEERRRVSWKEGEKKKENKIKKLKRCRMSIFQSQWPLGRFFSLSSLSLLSLFSSSLFSLFSSSLFSLSSSLFLKNLFSFLFSFLFSLLFYFFFLFVFFCFENCFGL